MLALICAIGAALAAFVVGRNAQPIGRAAGLLDFPDDAGGRKLHAMVTPLVGGVGLTLVTLGAIGATLAFGDGGPTIEHDLARLALAVGAMFLIGAADDRFELSIRGRLAMATLVLALVVGFVPDFEIAFFRFDRSAALVLLGTAGLPFTLLCLVGLLNAVNMADGKNGIVLGLALVWSVFLLAYLPATVRPVIAAVAAATAVLFAFNMRGRLFLGDGGSYALSALFGLLAIYAYNHAFGDIGGADIVLLFTLPVLDTLRLLVTRILQRRSPFAAGRDHLHHYIYAKVGWPIGLAVYLALAALPVAGAALWPGSALSWLGITIIAYLAVLVATQRR